MVRDSISLKEAVTHLSIPLTSQECQNVLRRKSFQVLLRNVKTRFRAEVANAPGRNKVSTIGQLQILADKLESEGAHDKAGQLLLSIAKLEGWTSDGGVVNVFGGLSQKDIDALKKQVEDQLDAGVSTESTQLSKPN